MTAQQLKNSILQMAVQGKLVPQDPADEPASELLRRIKAEKQALVKAGKIKADKKSSEIFRGTSRNIPYTFCEQVGREIRDISDEIPFDIPESWEWCRLGYISTYNEKKQKVSAQNADVSIWELDLEDIEKGGKLLVKMTVGERKSVGDKTVFGKGDILYSKLRPYLLKILVAPDNGICTPEIVPFTVYGDISTEYIVNYLKSPYVDGVVNGETYGIKMPRAGTETMINLLVPLPPLPEQHRIIQKIEELLPHIEKYEKAETELTALNTAFPEQLKRSVLQQAVQGKLVPQDPADEPASELLRRIKAEKQALVKAGKIKKDKHESVIITCDKIPYELPDSWVWCRLGSIVNAVSARRVHQSDWKNNGIPFYRAREIVKLAENGYVDNELFISEELYEEYSKSGVPQSGDLMITAVGTLGKTYIVKGKDRFYYKDASVICLENYGKINSKYLKYLIMSPYMETVIKDNSSGTTVDTITLAKANEYMIPLPPLAEQHRIVSKIEELMKYCEML